MHAKFKVEENNTYLDADNENVISKKPSNVSCLKKNSLMQVKDAFGVYILIPGANNLRQGNNNNKKW